MWGKKRKKGVRNEPCSAALLEVEGQKRKEVPISAWPCEVRGWFEALN